MDFKLECVSRSYTIEVDLVKIEASDSEKDIHNKQDEILYNQLSKLEGVSNADYNGHFGPYIWLTIEPEFETPELWLKIENLIKSSYKSLDV